jgi:outer membrane protein assembly factor BamB
VGERSQLFASQNGTPVVLRVALFWLFVTVPVALAILPAQAAFAARAPLVLPAGTQDWPTYLHDSQRSGASGEQLITSAQAPQLTKLWSFKTGGAIAAQAAIVGGIAYVGSWDGNEYAINVQTGAELWATNLGTSNQPACYPPNPGITSSATVSNGVVYVGGGNAYWYALDANTGAILWDVYTGDNSAASGHYNWSSPLIYNGYAYIGVASNCDNPLVQGQVLQVSLSTHQIVNTLSLVPNGQVGGGVWTSPTVDPATNTIYVTTGTLNQVTQTLSQAIVAFDANTLTVKSFWQIPAAQAVIDSDWGTTPILMTDSQGDQLVAAINKNGYVYAFNRANLSAGPVWERYIAAGGDCPQCGDGSASSSTFANGVLYISGGNTTINGVGYPGFVDALDPGTGNIIWQHGTVGPVIAAITYYNGLIIDGAGSTVEVLDATAGTRLYSYQTGQLIYSPPSVSAGIIVIGSVDANIYAFTVGTPVTPPTDPNCPTGWLCQDIGSPAPAGSETVTSGTWSVAAGGAGIGGSSDQFRFMSQATNGDTQIVAAVTAPATGQAGIMIRQSNDPTSPFYAVSLTSSTVTVQSRTAFGGATTTSTVAPKTLPQYLEIQRQGDQFQSATSSDGVNFTLVPGTTQSFAMPATVMTGLLATSLTNGTSATETLSSVTIGAISNTPAPNPSPDPCPSGWTCTDVGNPAVIGDQTLANGTWNLQGSGTGITMSQYSDQFHFVEQSLSTDATISARIVSQSLTSGNAASGLMIRANATGNAAYYAAIIVPGKGLTVLYRPVNGLRAFQLVQNAATLPAYIEIARSGDYLSTYTSPDGVTWTPVAESTIALSNLASAAVIGMVVTSGTTTTTNASSVDSVTVSASAPLPPTLCPSGWSCADIGNPPLAGTQIYATTSWQVIGAGGDIWGVSDQFHFVSQTAPLAGDGNISAHITSQTNTDPWAKGGVMMRLTSDPGSPYYAVFATPGNGIVVQYRSTQGGTTSSIGTTGTVPTYVMAARAGTTYTGYTSSDGINWTAIPNSAITLSNLSGNVMVGMAVTSHQPAQLSDVTFDTVAVGVLNTCPVGWTCGDIGGATPSGQQTDANGSWSIGGGGGDIWGTSDAFHFVNQTLAGDGYVNAHITSQTNTDPWAKAGVMLRLTADPGSPYYAVFVTPANGVAVQYRAAQGGTTSQVLISGVVPLYLMVARAGTTFTAYSSSDGATWTLIPNATQTLSNITGTVLAGLAVTSHNTASLSTAAFDTVTIAAGAPVLTLCPTGWTCQDIGNPTPVGTQSDNNGAWSIQGGGTDIYGTADAFRLVSQTLAGDGTVSAHITSQTNTSAWAKAGVMLRLTADPGSPYYAIFVTPGNGIVVQYRSTQGGTTGQIAVTGTVPTYLEVVRTGTTFEAYTSIDGTSWTAVPNSTKTLANLTGTLLAGMAVTSHNAKSLCTVAFDTVVI